jgi:2-haloacid dehalogenase
VAGDYRVRMGTRQQTGQSQRPEVVVFDVNETLSDLSALQQRFTDLGAPAWLAQVWFGSVLRDGFARAVTGGSERFAVIADQQLRGLLPAHGVEGDLDEAVGHVLGGFAALPLHPDVVPGVRALGVTHRLVTLTNGAATVAQRLLGDAGVAGHFEHLLSVEDAGVWKPHAEAYAYAARVCGTDPARMMLVAVHPWDVDGALRAGLQAAWVDRDGRPYPSYFAEPTVTVTSLSELADALAD